MKKPISQREARRLRKDAAALREKLKAAHSRWCNEYPGGFHIANLEMNDRTIGRMEGGEFLDAAFIAKRCGAVVRLYMVPKP